MPFLSECFFECVTLLRFNLQGVHTFEMAFRTFIKTDFRTWSAAEALQLHRRIQIHTRWVQRPHAKFRNGAAPNRKNGLAQGRSNVHQAGIVRDDFAGFLGDQSRLVQGKLSASVLNFWPGGLCNSGTDLLLRFSPEQNDGLLDASAEFDDFGFRQAFGGVGRTDGECNKRLTGQFKRQLGGIFRDKIIQSLSIVGYTQVFDCQHITIHDMQLRHSIQLKLDEQPFFPVQFVERVGGFAQRDFQPEAPKVVVQINDLVVLFVFQAGQQSRRHFLFERKHTVHVWICLQNARKSVFRQKMNLRACLFFQATQHGRSQDNVANGRKTKDQDFQRKKVSKMGG